MQRFNISTNIIPNHNIKIPGKGKKKKKLNNKKKIALAAIFVFI